FVHNLGVEGQLIQSSARMKAYWTQVLGLNWAAGPRLIGYVIRQWGLALLLTSGVITYAVHFKNFSFHKFKEWLRSPQGMWLFLSVFGMSAYSCLYVKNAAIMPWYTSNFFLSIMAGLS